MSWYLMAFVFLVVCGVLLLAIHRPKRGASTLARALAHAEVDAALLGTGYIRIERHGVGPLSYARVHPAHVYEVDRLIQHPHRG